MSARSRSAEPGFRLLDALFPGAAAQGIALLDRDLVVRVAGAPRGLAVRFLARAIGLGPAVPGVGVRFLARAIGPGVRLGPGMCRPGALQANVFLIAHSRVALLLGDLVVGVRHGDPQVVARLLVALVIGLGACLCLPLLALGFGHAYVLRIAGHCIAFLARHLVVGVRLVIRGLELPLRRQGGGRIARGKRQRTRQYGLQ